MAVKKKKKKPVAKKRPAVKRPAVRRVTRKVRAEQPRYEEPVAPSVPVEVVRRVNMTGLDRLMLEAELKRRTVYEPAATNFSRFVQATKADMAWGWFYEELCVALEQFLEDVMAGRQPRLMLFAPPQHGKSEIVSRRFPAYAFGRFPMLRFIATSYGATLATRMNRDVQRIIDGDDYRQIFPKTTLNTENVATLSGKPLRNMDIFEIVDNVGSYRGAGVGGGITGMGYDIGIIDDPIADAAAALSKTVKDSIWEWYQSTFNTRQAPKAGILLMMTRWATDDLAGRLLEEAKKGGDQWKVIRYPAIAEEDEKHRKTGEALAPHRYDVDRLTSLMKAAGTFFSSAMYQQHPTPLGGNIFKRNNFRFYTMLPVLEEIVISVDCKFKDKETGSRVSVSAWGRRGPEKYLLRRVADHLGYAATKMAVRTFVGLYPQNTAILIEDKANGPAIISELRETFSNVVAIEPFGGKEARAYAIQPEQEAGMHYLPDPTIDPTIEEWLGEVCAFPGGAYDDETDGYTQYVNWQRMRQTGGAYGYYLFIKEAAEAQAKRTGATDDPAAATVPGAEEHGGFQPVQPDHSVTQTRAAEFAALAVESQKQNAFLRTDQAEREAMVTSDSGWRPNLSRSAP